MTDTITFPSDPVVKGATEIQSTNFALVAADYTKIDWQEAKSFVGQQIKAGQRVDLFPNGAVQDFNWKFALRKDITGVGAAQRNLIGARSTVNIVGAKGYLPDVGSRQNSFVIRTVEIHNWYTIVVTQGDGTVTPLRLLDRHSHSFVETPGGEILYGVGDSNMMLETLGFLAVPSAATTPTVLRGLNLATGGWLLDI
jgi:hypothetical protein